MNRILVLGASGVLGQRIVCLARRLIPEAEVIGAARHPPRRANIEFRCVDVHDCNSLEQALCGVQALINAVGPYEYDPRKLLACCFEAGCHYTDLSEMPAFIDSVEQIASSLPVRSQAPAVVSGCSTVPGLVEVLAQQWAAVANIRRIRILLSMGSNNSVSPAMSYSLLRPMGRQIPGGGHYFREVLKKEFADERARLYGRYPSVFDESALLLGDRSVPAEFHAGFDRASYARVLTTAAKWLPRLSDRSLHRLCRASQLLLRMARCLGTKTGILSIEALDDAERVVREIQVRASQDGLNVPALPSVWAVRQLLRHDNAGSERTGPIKLSQLMTPDQAICWLREDGYVVRQSTDGLESTL